MGSKKNKQHRHSGNQPVPPQPQLRVLPTEAAPNREPSVIPTEGLAPADLCRIDTVGNKKMIVMRLHPTLFSARELDLGASIQAIALPSGIKVRLADGKILTYTKPKEGEPPMTLTSLLIGERDKRIRLSGNGYAKFYAPKEYE